LAWLRLDEPLESCDDPAQTWLKPPWVSYLLGRGGISDSIRGGTMSKEYDDFLVQQNIDRFTRLLEAEKNTEKRATLTQLLQEERAKMNSFSQSRDAFIRG
jgi:hypothetical protein